MQKTIEGYLDCLEGEYKYILFRLKHVEDPDWIYKYTIKEQELSSQISRLRKWLNKQGE